MEFLTGLISLIHQYQGPFAILVMMFAGIGYAIWHHFTIVIIAAAALGIFFSAESMVARFGWG